jgi:hypothetical protein
MRSLPVPGTLLSTLLDVDGQRLAAAICPLSNYAVAY